MKQKQHLAFMILLISAASFIGMNIYAYSSEDLQKGNAYTLKELIGEALRLNPAINAAKLKYDAYKSRIPQAKALPDPMLTVKSKSMGNPLPFIMLGKSEFDSIGIMATQDFPYPGKLKLQGDTARLEALSAEQDLESIKLEIITNLTILYFDYLQTTAKIDILEHNKQFLEQFEKTAQSRYSVGEGIMQDVLKAQYEISIAHGKIIEAKSEQASILSKINTILNRLPSEPIQISGELEARVPLPSFQDLAEQLKNNNPELKSLLLIIEASKKSLELAKKENYPDFSISAGYEYLRNFQDMWEINFGIILPIFNKIKRNYAIIESEKNEQIAETMYERRYHELLEELKNAHLAANASEELINLYGSTIIPQAKSALEAALINYQVGKSDFLTIINNFITILDYQLKYNEQLALYQKSYAIIIKLTGQELQGSDPRNITLK